MVDLADADVLAILTRAPSSGGKTRLLTALGRPSDAALLTALLLDTLDGATTSGVTTVLAVTPASSIDEVRSLAAGTCMVAQPKGALGARMRGTMEALFAAGARAVTLIGSDLPSITAAPVRAAFARLRAEPDALVLGPALDGGYYLIAATRVPDVFEGIEWGSDRVLAQTRTAAALAGLQVHLVDPVADVDTVDDLMRLSSKARRMTAWLRANGLDGRST